MSYQTNANRGRSVNEFTSAERFLEGVIDPAALRRQARVVRAVRRRRKIDIVDFVMSTVMLVCGRGGQSFAEMRRDLLRRTGVHVARSAFWDRFTPGYARLLAWLLGVLQKRAWRSCPRYRGRLKHFSDVLAIDSTVITLDDSLARRWKGTRSNRKAALKVHTIVRACTGELLRHKITAEAHGDGRELKVGSWARGALFLFDRAYRSASSWSRVHRLGGYFVTRLPASYTARIVANNRRHRGRARAVIGKPIKEAVGGLKRAFIDVDCSFNIRIRAYRSRRGRRLTQTFRVVGIWQPKHKRYLLFVTNLPVDGYNPEDVSELYRLRAEVEHFYRMAKGGLGLNELPTTKPHIVQAFVRAALIRASVAMQARRQAERHLPSGRWINAETWTRTWRSALESLLFGATPKSWFSSWRRLAHVTMDPNLKRPPLRTLVAGAEATGAGTVFR